MKKFLLSLLAVLFTMSVSAGEVTDLLNSSVTGVSGTSYADFSGKSASSNAVYAGQCAGTNGTIQLRSKNNNSGVVTTASGGKVTKVVITWDSQTAGERVLDVYGSNTAYTAATDLYNSATQGTCLGSLTCSEATDGVSTIEVIGDYEFIGFRSAGNALYLTSVEITWSTGDAITVAKPAITPNGGSFIGSQDVTLSCETEGATIYYTLDGEDPTTESTQYTDAFAVTETTTVKAIAVKDNVQSGIATATFTLIPTYSSISAVTALTNNDVFVFTGEALIVAKPTAKHVYIQDETGSVLVYDSTGEKTAAAEVGKTMAANWSGKVSIYKKLFEIVPDQAIAVKDGDAATVTYPEATAEDITLENVNKVVLLKGITSYSVDGKNLTITIGENEIVGYNQFNLEIADAEEGKTYEIVGAISRYNDNIQFQPIEIKEAEEEPAKLFADGKYYILNYATEKSWGAGNNWGTQASLIEHPEFVTLIGNEDGTYKMETQVENEGNHFFDGEWMDSNPPASLTITRVEEPIGYLDEQETIPVWAYTIANGDVYYGWDGSSTLVARNIDPTSENALWLIISEEEAMAGLANATADEPIDATFLIADPNFSRNHRSQNAWLVSADCTNRNLSGGNNTNNCVESWHSTFVISQAIANAPKGVYKLTAQGFYRQDGSDNEHLPVFFANDETSTFPAKTGTENGMSDASGSFSAGLYKADPIFFEVTEDGGLTIGARLEENTNLWCIWDNFALEYYGPDADINEVKFGDLIVQVDDLKMKATELSEDEGVSPKTLTLLADAIAGADNLQTAEDYNAAIAALNTAVSQAEKDVKNKASIEGMYTLIESTNVVTEEALTTYKSMADTYNSDWEEGTLTETVVNPYAIAGWHSANAYDDFLLSAWAIGDKQCKDFEASLYINTWSTEGENDGTEFKVPFFEYFTDASNALGANTLTATIQDLAPGKYVVKAWVRNQPKNGVEAADISGITMTVNEGTAVDVTEGEVKGGFNIGEFAAVGTVDVDGILKVSFNVAEDNNSHWLSFQNVEFEMLEEPVNLDFELSDAIDGSVNTYAKDIAEGKPYANMQEVPGWTIVENGDARAAAVFAYGSDSWVGGAGNTPPASAPEGSEGTKALGIEAVWSATAQYVQPVTLEAGNYIITVPIYNSNGGAQQLTKNLIGFIANDGIEYLAQSTSYPNNEWFIETISFTLDKVTTGCYSIGMSVPNTGNANVPHLFIDKFDVKYVSAEEIAAAKLAEAKDKANAALDALVPFGDGLFMYNEAEVAAAREAVANATTAEAVEAIEMPKANAPKADAKYSFQQKASGLYLSTYVETDGEGVVTASGVCLAEEPVYFTFEAGEGGYYLANGEEYVGFAGTNNWTMAATADKKMLISPAVVSVEDVFYYTLNEAKGMIASDGTEAGAACYTDKSVAKSGDKAYWTIAAFEEDVDPNDYTNYIVNADLTGEGGFDATGTKGIDGSGIVKAGNNAQFDFKQTIENLPAGKYKLTAQAAYRYGGDEQTEYDALNSAEIIPTKHAVLYAVVGEKMSTAAVQNRYDGASETDLSGEGAVQVNGLWVPNSSNAVKAWFAAGKYVNEVEFNLPADGAVTIGILKQAQPDAGDYTVIGPWTLTRIGDAEVDETVLAEELTVDRYTGMGYNVTEAEVDFTAAKEFLGVEAITYDMVRIVNPDGEEISDYAPYDGWFNADGVAETWGSNTKVCVKFWQAIEDGKYEICDMNGADIVDQTYTVKWALVANDKKVFYTINVKFVDKPAIAITYDDLNIVETVTSDFSFEVGTCYQGSTATVDVAAILAELGVASLDDVTIYAVQSDKSLDDNYKLGTTDGWRNAAGDWQGWGADAYFYVKADFSAAESQLYQVGTMDPESNTNIAADDVYTAKYVFVKGDDAHSAVELDVVVTMTSAVGINGIALDGENNTIYDLTGRRVKNVVKGNLYIVNGKKVLVK